MAAILEALCHMTTTKLTDIIPLSSAMEQCRSSAVAAVVNPEPRFRHRGDATSATDDNKYSANCSNAAGMSIGEAVYYPLLVGHMLHQTEMELLGRSHYWTFRDILDRLLMIAGLPMRHALGLVSSVFSFQIDHYASVLKV